MGKEPDSTEGSEAELPKSLIEVLKARYEVYVSAPSPRFVVSQARVLCVIF